MKIDLKQLAKLEKQYRFDNPVALNTLQSMVDIVLQYNEASYALAPNNVELALTTLKELGVITYEASLSAQQLNS